ncbi:MAG: tetraacyldisaccharide 4'-kinase, partial [Thermovirgaceae bacterium]|nr:tetraacyldisaccharide 4'-kinase [Thermovirgaceae bacterium]
MGALLASYLRYIRGEGRLAFWSILAPLGWFVRACSGVRNFAYDHGIASSTEPPVPVVSVGNITHGGTNKTPFVEMLARLFLEAGLTPGIVIRGYGRSGNESLFAGECPQSRDLLGDEALLLSGRLPGVPVAVAAERMTGIEFLAGRGTDVAIADDGFQHRRMGRDVDIVLVDATCPFGNGRLMPAGMLREPVNSISRAHIAVITKADQVPPGSLRELEELVLEMTGRAPFLAILELSGWSKLSAAGSGLEDSPPPDMLVSAFSAIGNPGSFGSFLSKLKLKPLSHEAFRDHHRFTCSQLDGVCERALGNGAGAMVCTEKDIFNLPPEWESPLPVLVPRVRASLLEPESFRSRLSECLKPLFVVASNGHGEDAIGSLLAEKLKTSFPLADVSGFSLVGRGKEYESKGVDVASPPCETPSGGVVKYRLKDLLSDIRSGLFRHISDQAEAWNALRGRIRTVLCVGDVYLLLHTLWGQGVKPVLLATAKSARLHGHWLLEMRLLKGRCRRVWTRDPETAAELTEKGVDAFFGGNPIMDLAGDTIYRPGERGNYRVLLLPGSRERAYEDLGLLLEASVLVSEEENC